MLKVCPVCGKELEPTRVKQKYCSASCCGKAYRARADKFEVVSYAKTCTVCGKKFTAKRDYAKYCSEKCRNLAKTDAKAKKNKAEEPKVENFEVKTPHLLKPLVERFPKVCVVCGKKFMAIMPHAKYCSQECVNRAAYKRSHKGETGFLKTCAYCGKEFETYDRFKKFCSKKCYQNSQEAKKPNKRESQLEENARRADECGLSYGRFTAMLRLGKTYEELKAAHLAELNRLEVF